MESSISGSTRSDSLWVFFVSLLGWQRVAIWKGPSVTEQRGVQRTKKKALKLAIARLTMANVARFNQPIWNAKKKQNKHTKLDLHTISKRKNPPIAHRLHFVHISISFTNNHKTLQYAVCVTHFLSYCHITNQLIGLFPRTRTRSLSLVNVL